MTRTGILFSLVSMAASTVGCISSSTYKYDAGASGGRVGTGGSKGSGGVTGSGGGYGGSTSAYGGAGGSMTDGAGGTLTGGAGGAMTGGAGGTLTGAGGSAGATDAGIVDDAATSDGATDAPADVPADVAIDGAPAIDGADEADGGAVRVCGPFANGGAPTDAGTMPSPIMSFFVSSLTSVTGNLGGLAGADQRCQQLAAAVGLGSPLWHAYLSVEHDPPNTGPAVNARDRIGAGPWYNARGELVAQDLATLHARPGDAAVFLDERGNMINGHWTGSPSPVQHDILTGSNADGTLDPGKTCADWFSEQGPGADGGDGPVARVGHSDGLGPQCNISTSPIDYTSWNSSHDNAGCNDTQPLGGAGRIYCFKANQ